MKSKTIPWDGKQISKPGIYSGIPMAAYHDAKICVGPSISSGGLRKIVSSSPAHFFAEWPGNPKRIERKESRSLVLGRAAHHLLLGEKFFGTLFAVQPSEYPDSKTGQLKPWSNNAIFCREWNAQRAKEGRSILKMDEVEAIRGMAEALGQHPMVQHGALNGQIERSIFWKDKKTGIWLKQRPDAIPLDSADFVDLKTTASVQWIDLMKSMDAYGYRQQAALAHEAATEVLNLENPTFTLIFVESDVPHCVRPVTVKSNDIDLGMRENRAAIDIFHRCLNSSHWPGPGGEREDAEYIEISERARRAAEDRLTILGAG